MLLTDRCCQWTVMWRFHEGSTINIGLMLFYVLSPVPVIGTGGCSLQCRQRTSMSTILCPPKPHFSTEVPEVCQWTSDAALKITKCLFIILLKKATSHPQSQSLPLLARRIISLLLYNPRSSPSASPLPFHSFLALPFLLLRSSLFSFSSLIFSSHCPSFAAPLP